MAKKSKSGKSKIDETKSAELSDEELGEANGGVLIGLLQPVNPTISQTQVDSGEFDANLPINPLNPKDPTGF